MAQITYRKIGPFYDRLCACAEQVKHFSEVTVSNRLKFPVKIDDEAARVIAANIINKGASKIWLNGESVSKENLRLRFVLEYLNEDTKQ